MHMVWFKKRKKKDQKKEHIDSFIDPPWAPGKPYIKDIAKTSASLQWTRPEHDGGAKIESYVIELLKSGTEEWVRVAEDVPVTEHLLKGLKEKQEYSFRVKAVNAAGESEPSDPSDPVVCKDRLCEYISWYRPSNHIDRS